MCQYKHFLNVIKHLSILQTGTTRKLVGQKSEGEAVRLNHEDQNFVADFSQFAPKVEENQTVENNVPPSQPFAGVRGAFHIYKKPGLSEYKIFN